MTWNKQKIFAKSWHIYSHHNCYDQLRISLSHISSSDLVLKHWHSSLSQMPANQYRIHWSHLNHLSKVCKFSGMQILSYKNNEQIGSRDSPSESLVIYISINNCLYCYVEDISRFSKFNYLPLLTSGSLKLSFCTFTWELHFHLDNHRTGKTTASYYWNLSVWVRHLRATVLLSRPITPLICMLNCSFTMFAQ